MKTIEIEGILVGVGRHDEFVARTMEIARAIDNGTYQKPDYSKEPRLFVEDEADATSAVIRDLKEQVFMCHKALTFLYDSAQVPQELKDMAERIRNASCVEEANEIQQG